MNNAPMTDTELNVKLAEALGWTKKEIEDALELKRLKGEYRRLPKKESFGGWALMDKIEKLEDVREIPNYTGSYDAVMPEIIKLKSSKPWSSRFLDHEDHRFVHILGKIVGVELITHEGLTTYACMEEFKLLRATPAQLSRALYLTLTQ